jgi:hypothetical protein
VIEKMIEVNQRMLTLGSGAGGPNTAAKRLYVLQIKMLHNSPRDLGRLENLLKTKESIIRTHFTYWILTD